MVSATSSITVSQSEMISHQDKFVSICLWTCLWKVYLQWGWFSKLYRIISASSRGVYPDASAPGPRRIAADVPVKLQSDTTI